MYPTHSTRREPMASLHRALPSTTWFVIPQFIMIKQRHYSTFRREVEDLLKFLKKQSLGPRTKGLHITLGITPSEDGLSWDYQTGDNSFTGGAYGHPHWVLLYLMGRSNCKELSKEAVEQLKELLAQGG